MADAKISQLPVATTPLAGTELVPVVQGGVTVQTTVGDVLTGAVPSGTANGVLYLNGSKVVTSGSALTFDGTNFRNTSGMFEGIDNMTLSALVSSTNATVLTLNSAGTSGTTRFQINGSEQMLLTSTGLGIGTNNPTDKLTVSGSAAFSRIGFNANAIDVVSTSQSFARFQSTGGDFYIGTESSVGGAFFPGSTAYAAVLFNASVTPMHFYTAAAVRATIDASGNLGIGTSSPGYKLDVVGVGKASSAFAIGDSSGNLSGAFTNESDVSKSVTFTADPANVGASSFMRWNVDGTERMRLDSSGNLGLGVTPSVTDALYYRSFELGKNGSGLHAVTTSLTASELTWLTNNSYPTYSSGIVWKYGNDGSAVRYALEDGEHKWLTAPSGTAGNAISFTQAMTLDASGRLLIGQTTEKTQEVVRIASAGQASMLLDNTGKTNGAFVGVFNDAALFGVNRNPSTGVFYNTSNYAADIVAVGSSSTSYIAFETSAAANTIPTERARITSGGDLLVGTLAQPSGASCRQVVKYDTSDYISYFWNSNASPYGVRVQHDTDVNGTSNPFLICVANATERASIRSNGGLANYQSNNVDLSDARTKKDIAPAPSYWGKIGALEIVTYKYKDQTHDDVNVGVIAQQVEQVEPVWVDSDGFGETPEDGIPLKTVYTKDITFAAIKALQEAMTRIEQLEARLAAAGI